MRVLTRSSIRKAKIREEAVAGFARFLMRRLGFPSGSELSVLFAGSRKMRRLNERYRGERGETDVLAFPLEETDGSSAAPLVGDIVICVDTARRQARRWGTELSSELLLYLTHGILHLRGWDDSSPALREKMMKKQESLLHEALKKGRWNVIDW